MKTTLCTFFVITMICCGTFIYAQCDANTPLGSTINEFDWQQSTFQLYVIEDNSQIVPVTAPSPFHSANFSAQENVTHLALPVIKDYHVEDGWELLYVNFGTPSLGVAEPSFALYNRFDGLTRIFFWMTANEGNTYNSAVLKVANVPDLGKNSAIFENINAPANALDNFEKGLSIERHNAYAESVGTWIISEFATAYDPCSCEHATAVIARPFLISVSTLELTIEGTAITAPLMSGGSVTNQSGFIEAIGDINDAFQSIAGITDKGQKTFKRLTHLGNEIQELVDANNFLFPNVQESSAFPAFLSAVPKIGLGVQIFNFLVGGGKSTASSTPTVFMERHRYQATGQLETVGGYSPARFFTPGSDREDFDDTAMSPAYDNVLGVANILNTPVLNVFESEKNHEMEDYGHGDYIETFDLNLVYQLAAPVEYVVNSIAGTVYPHSLHF